MLDGVFAPVALGQAWRGREWVKTSQGAALLARQVYLSKRPCPVRGRVGGLGPSADIAVLLAIGAVL